VVTQAMGDIEHENGSLHAFYEGMIASAQELQ
jgi:hypothetical protein